MKKVFDPSLERRVCTFCVMDSSVPSLDFDLTGQCSCCRQSLERRPSEWFPDRAGEQRLERLARSLKLAGRGRAYDCVIGLSGGIDSAYLAHLVVRVLGLRALAVHVDAGWNTGAAVSNIERLVRGLSIDLHTFVVDWQEMRDLQYAFLKASVFNQDIPQDHAFFAVLHRTSIKYRISHFLSGVNFSSENIVPLNWSHSYTDSTHIRAIHRRFGTRALSKYPFLGLPEFVWLTRLRKQLTIHKPLNLVNYNKNQAKVLLASEYGWADYGGKHHESRFTKFYQETYLPKKFGFDKRRLHMSSLVVAGQLTREAALRELQSPIVDPASQRRDIHFVAKKLSISVTELEQLIEAPPVSHLAYPNQVMFYKVLVRLKRIIGKYIVKA